MVDLECCGLAAEVNVIADNVELDSGSGGATLAADEIGGIHHQRVKVEWGADGAANDTAVATPFPIAQQPANDQVDSNNTTTTPLGGDAVFTGTGTDVLGYAAVTITLAASHDSAAGGMSFQFSTDDSNWDDTYDFTMDVSDSDVRRFQFPITAQYFRLVYTNGSTLQTHFRVQTILHIPSQLTSIHRLGDDMSADRSAQVVKAAVFGLTATGNYTPVLNHADGAMVTAVHAHDEGGTDIFRSLDLDESPEEVAGAQANGYWIAGFNAVNQLRYLKLYNAAVGDVTVGTTTPVVTIPLAKESPFFMSVTNGVFFDTGITVACTTGAADNNTGAPGANDVILNFGYKTSA